MKQLNEFKSNLSTAVAICGGAGAGKTSLGMRLFPKTYVYVADLNLQSGIDYVKKTGDLPNIVGFDMAYQDDAGKTVLPNARYDLMWTRLTRAIADPSIDCIMLDGAMQVEDVIKGKICNALTDSAIKLEGFSQWGMLVLIWKSLILQLRQSGKKIVFIFHENKEQDESDKIYKYQLAVDGSIRGKMPALFSDVWRVEIDENMGKHSWMVRMLSNARQEHLKRSSTFSTLPPRLPQDDLVKFVHSIK